MINTPEEQFEGSYPFGVSNRYEISFSLNPLLIQLNMEAPSNHYNQNFLLLIPQ